MIPDTWILGLLKVDTIVFRSSVGTWYFSDMDNITHYEVSVLHGKRVKDTSWGIALSFLAKEIKCSTFDIWQRDFTCPLTIT